jgi:hypothetical protein
MDGFVPPRCLTLDLLRDTTDNGFMLVNVDPKNDYAFKAVVGSPRHRRVLIHLLTAILGPYGLRVRHVRVVNPLSQFQQLNDKKLILDVKARDAQGRNYNIEMQMVPHPAFPGRFLYYWSTLIYTCSSCVISTSGWISWKTIWIGGCTC